MAKVQKIPFLTGFYVIWFRMQLILSRSAALVTKPIKTTYQTLARTL
jgi:hypothetical protein